MKRPIILLSLLGMLFSIWAFGTVHSNSQQSISQFSQEDIAVAIIIQDEVVLIPVQKDSINLSKLGIIIQDEVVLFIGNENPIQLADFEIIIQDEVVLLAIPKADIDLGILDIIIQNEVVLLNNLSEAINLLDTEIIIQDEVVLAPIKNGVSLFADLGIIIQDEVVLIPIQKDSANLSKLGIIIQDEIILLKGEENVMQLSNFEIIIQDEVVLFVIPKVDIDLEALDIIIQDEVVLFQGTEDAMIVTNFSMKSQAPENLVLCGTADTVSITIINQNAAAEENLSLEVIFPNNGNGLQIIDWIPQSGIMYPNQNSNNFLIETLDTQDSVTIQFLIKADCEIIPFAENNPITIQFDLFEDGNAVSSLTHVSTENASNAPINIYEPNLLLSNFDEQNHTGILGETFTRTLHLTNTAAQSFVEEFILLHSKENGLQLNDISVGEIQDGEIYFNDPTFSDYWVYVINSADISNFGDGDDLLEEGETIFLTETLTINGTENVNSNYFLQWGCDLTLLDYCEEQNFTATVILASGTPIIESFTTISPEDYPICAGPDNPFHVTYYFVNNGQEDLEGAGTAFLEQIDLGPLSVSGVVGAYKITDYNWGGFLVNDFPLAANEISFGNAAFIPNAYFFRYQKGDFPSDFDGVGGLIDQNNDGLFFDLPIGDTLIIEFDIWRVCDDLFGENAYNVVPPYTTCLSPLNLLTTGRDFEYSSQHGETFSTLTWDSFTAQRNKYGTELLTYPSDVYLNEPFNIEYLVGELFQNIEMCSEDSMFVALQLPAGFSLVPTGSFMIEKYDGGSVASGNSMEIPIPIIINENGKVVFLLKNSRPSPIGNNKTYWQYALNIQVVNLTPIVNCESSEIVIDLTSYSTCSSCSDCVSKWNEDCHSLIIQAHNNVGCTDEFPGGGFGIKTYGFDWGRINFSPWQDHEMIIPTDPELCNKQAGFPHDTIRASFPARFLGDATIGFDSLMVEICYEHSLRDRWLQPLGGKAQFFNGTIQEIDIPPQAIETAETIEIQNYNRCYLFNISEAIPNSINAQNGDSLFVEIDFEILRQHYIWQIEGGGRDLVEGWMGQVFVMKGDQRFSTDVYGSSFEFVQNFLAGHSNANLTSKGCETISWDYGSNQNAIRSNGSAIIFPNEFRPEAMLDSIVVSVLENFEVLNDSFVLKTKVTATNLDGTSSNGTIITTQTIRPDTTFANGRMILTFKNGKDGINWQAFEVHTENTWKQIVPIEIQPTCGALDLTISDSLVFAKTYFKEIFNGIIDTTYASNSQRMVNYIPPKFELTPVQETINAETNVACWDLVFSNLNNISSDFNWIAFENTSEDIDFISCTETTNGTNTDIPLVVYDSQAGSAVWAKVAALLSAETRTFQICAEYTTCDLDSVQISHSFACSEYPASPAVTDCQHSATNLFLDPISSKLQIEIVDSPEMPVDLCAELPYEIQISNINQGTANELEMSVLLPSNATMNYIGGTSEMTFLNSNIFEPINDPIQNGNTLTWQLSNEMTTNLWGQQHGDSSKVIIQFSLETACPITDGSVLTFFANAFNNCGTTEEAITNSPEPISINGLESSETTFEFSVLNKTPISPCGSPGSFNFEIKNAGNFSTLGKEVLSISYPSSINWTVSNITDGQNNLESTIPIIETLSNETTLRWQLKDNFLPDELININLVFESTSNEFDCAIFDFHIKLQEISLLNCITGGTCEVENILFEFEEIMNVDLASIELSNINIEYLTSSTDAILVKYNMDLTNSGGAITEDVLLHFYDNNGTEFNTQTLALSIANSQTSNVEGQFETQSLTCPMQLNITGCLCEPSEFFDAIPIFKDTTSIEICEEEIYDFNGFPLSETGLYCQNYLGFNNCDSIVCIDLLVLNDVLNLFGAFICEGDTYPFEGQVLSETGDYCFTYLGVNGCDSVRCLDLVVLDTFLNIENAQICAGELFSFEGQDYTQTGTYCTTYTSIINCDSTRCVDLTVLDTFYTVEYIQICAGEVFDFDGQQLFETGIYEKDFFALNGCDSTHIINLIILDTFYISETQEICAGDSFDFDGQILFENGIYCHDYSTIYGCDSTRCVDLIVLDTFRIINFTEICEDETIDFNGEIISEAGLYCQEFTAFNGCDSTYCMDVNLIATIETAELLEFCEGETVEWNGDILTEPDSYFFENQAISVGGCDSIHLTEIVIYPKPSIEIITANTNLNLGESIVLSANSDSGAFFEWSPSESLSCDDCNAPIANPINDTEYVVTVTDLNNCTNEVLIRIEVGQCAGTPIKFPTEITLNFDGIEDEFGILNPEVVEGLKSLRIFNRMGIEVFQTNDKFQKWDATFKGSLVTGGLYTYLIEAICIDGNSFILDGSVTVIR